MQRPSRTPRRKAASIRGFGLASGLAPLRRLSARPEAMRSGWIMAALPKQKASAKRDWRSRQVLETRSAVGGGSGRRGASARRGPRAGRRHGRLVVDVAVEMGVLVGGAVPPSLSREAGFLSVRFRAPSGALGVSSENALQVDEARRMPGNL